MRMIATPSTSLIQLWILLVMVQHVIVLISTTFSICYNNDNDSFAFVTAFSSMLDSRIMTVPSKMTMTKKKKRGSVHQDEVFGAANSNAFHNRQLSFRSSSCSSSLIVLKAGLFGNENNSNSTSYISSTADWQIYVDQSRTSLDHGGSATLDAFYSLCEPTMATTTTTVIIYDNDADADDDVSSDGKEVNNNSDDGDGVISCQIIPALIPKPPNGGRSPWIRCMWNYKKSQKNNSQRITVSSNNNKNNVNNSNTDSKNNQNNIQIQLSRNIDVSNVDSVEKVYYILTNHLGVKNISREACECLKWKYKGNDYLESNDITEALFCYNEALSICEDYYEDYYRNNTNNNRNVDNDEMEMENNNDDDDDDDDDNHDDASDLNINQIENSINDESDTGGSRYRSRDGRYNDNGMAVLQKQEGVILVLRASAFLQQAQSHKEILQKDIFEGAQQQQQQQSQVEKENNNNNEEEEEESALPSSSKSVIDEHKNIVTDDADGSSEDHNATAVTIATTIITEDGNNKDGNIDDTENTSSSSLSSLSWLSTLFGKKKDKNENDIGKNDGNNSQLKSTLARISMLQELEGTNGNDDDRSNKNINSSKQEDENGTSTKTIEEENKKQKENSRFRKIRFRHMLYQTSMLHATKDSLRATELLPDSASSWIMAGDMLSGIWKIQESRQYYETARSLISNDDNETDGIDTNVSKNEDNTWDEKMELQKGIILLLDELEKRQDLLDQSLLISSSSSSRRLRQQNDNRHNNNDRSYDSIRLALDIVG